MSMRVYIFGRGKGLAFVEKCLVDGTTIVAYIDNYTKVKKTDNGVPVIGQNEIIDKYDFVIVSLFKYHAIKEELVQIGMDPKKIICFFSKDDSEKEIFHSALDSQKWKKELAIKHQREVEIPRAYNLYYEINAKKLLEAHELPNIIDQYRTIDLIITQKKSLSRFGDGEFEIILGRNRPRFQSDDRKLGRKLKEVLWSHLPNLLIAVADNYGELSSYTEEAADDIREYLSPSVRKEHMSLLDLNRVYYDAYLSRPYLIYADKNLDEIKRKFSHIKDIWKSQEVLIVEGMHTRFGVGNDLLEESLSVKRILAPDKDAFCVYDMILDSIVKHGKDKLVLIILGPTATVLSYDLAGLGYWAVDIGQVDTEYEWYLRGVSERCDVPYKTISEYIDKDIFTDIEEPYKSIYEEQIVEIIE